MVVEINLVLPLTFLNRKPKTYIRWKYNGYSSSNYKKKQKKEEKGTKTTT
jgi:hypothetical protein